MLSLSHRGVSDADLAKRPFFPGLVAYFSSGPIIAMVRQTKEHPTPPPVVSQLMVCPALGVCQVWEGPDAIKTGRKILGATNPNAADVGR